VQIPAVFRAYAFSVRTIYLLTVMCALTVGGFAFLEFSAAWLRPGSSGGLDMQELVIIGFLLAYVIPAARATIRLARTRDLVPDAHLRERPVVAAVITIPAVLGILLLYLALHVWIEIQPWGHDDVGGPLGGAVILAILFHVFALMTGEIVLVGRTRSTTAMRSDPVS
jgi:hypothetical protein